MENPDDRRNTSKDLSGVISIKRAPKYGAIAGFIATWSISSAIAASEFELGMPISTFYTVMGIALGSDNAVLAAYLGFGLHLVTGTLLGSLIGILAVKIERFRKSNMANIFDPYRAVLMGMATGVLVWLVLFLPITLLLVQPSEVRIAEVLSSGGRDRDIGQSFRGIAISAILFHLVWGAIFGFIINSLLRIRLSKSLTGNSSSMPESHEFNDRSLRLAYFGLAAGVISSLAISAMVLMVEKVTSLPVGTFYYVLVAGLTNTYSGNFAAAVGLGLGMHLLAGSFMGLVMSLPFMTVSTRDDLTQSKGRGFMQRYTPLRTSVWLWPLASGLSARNLCHDLAVSKFL